MKLGDTSVAGTINRDLQQIEKDLGCQKFIWKGNEYVCIPSSQRLQRDLGVGGLAPVKNVKLSVRTCLFTDGIRPQGQELLTFKSIQYKIEDVVTNPTDSFLVLDCESDVKFR